MAKKGGSRHYIRITAPRTLPIVGRKSVRWMHSPLPGTHPKNKSFSMVVLLRDILAIATDAKEVKKMLNAGDVIVNGRKIKEIGFPAGIMDIIELPKIGKTYRMQVVGGKLHAKEIPAAQAKHKLCKIVGKRTISGKKTAITTHDGRNMMADDSLAKAKVGSTIVMSLPEFKIKKVLPMDAGAKCIVTDGAHAGEIATLEKTTQRAGSMGSEAQLKSGSSGFVTLTRYLFVVDDEFA